MFFDINIIELYKSLLVKFNQAAKFLIIAKFHKSTYIYKYMLLLSYN